MYNEWDLGAVSAHHLSGFSLMVRIGSIAVSQRSTIPVSLRTFIISCRLIEASYARARGVAGDFSASRMLPYPPQFFRPRASLWTLADAVPRDVDVSEEAEALLAGSAGSSAPQLLRPVDPSRGGLELSWRIPRLHVIEDRASWYDGP